MKTQNCSFFLSYLHSLSGINPERRAQAARGRRRRRRLGRCRRRMRAVLRPRRRDRHVAPRLCRGDVLRRGGRHHRRVLQVHLHPLGQRVDLRRRRRGGLDRPGRGGLRRRSRGPHGGEVVGRRGRGVQGQRHGGGRQVGRVVVLLDHVADVVDSRGRRRRIGRGGVGGAEMSRMALISAAVDGKMGDGPEVRTTATLHNV